MVLARAPEIVTWLGVTERVGAFQHPLNSVSRGLVQRDRSLARLVLAVRHTVVTDLLEAGEPEHVIEAITGHVSRRMLEHYSHQRLKAKGQLLARMEERRDAHRAIWLSG